MSKETINESHEIIKKEYIDNTKKLDYKWVGIKERIELLYDIAKNELSQDDELLKEILKTRNAINIK